jgi:hypothetical protein
MSYWYIQCLPMSDPVCASARRILGLGTRCSCQLHAPATLNPRETALGMRQKSEWLPEPVWMPLPRESIPAIGNRTAIFRLLT